MKINILHILRFRLKIFYAALTIVILLTQVGCKKFVEIDPPNTSINAGNVYLNDATATAVLTGIYTNLSNSYLYNLTSNSLSSSSLYLSLSADELTLYNVNNTLLFPYYTNDVLPTTNSFIWNSAYDDIIFPVSNAIEGLEKSNSLTPSVKQELLGEAKFMRAFAYFYLVNLYGPVPLVLNTEWKVNSSMARASTSDIYAQIIKDLKEAKDELSSNYLNSNLTSSTEKTRPNKWAASALLARVYLYNANYPDAEAEASSIISNTSLYGLESLNNVFKKSTNKEVIWQLQPTRSGTMANTGEGAIFLLPSTGPNTSNYPVYLSNDLVNSFETGDQRKTNWVDSVKPGSVAYYYPKKYKIGATNTPTQEYNMVMRLAEQYLIRSEARAKLNKLSDAIADLDVIRNRAGLPLIANTDPGISQSALLDTILHERRVELFTEWGHRWLDLKRTNRVDAVMSVVTPQKGGTWASYKALFPIPQSEIVLDAQLIQNNGY